MEVWQPASAGQETSVPSSPRPNGWMSPTGGCCAACSPTVWYVARHRNPWWSVGLRSPAPILATYMARRPPAFVRNLVGARHVNVAHGIYPREPLPDDLLDALAASLRTGVSVTQGRTYAGGLTKFEPSEMERIPVPNLAVLVTAGPPTGDDVTSRTDQPHPATAIRDLSVLSDEYQCV